MKSAFIQLKNGYNTVLSGAEFLTEEEGRIHLWGEKGQIGLFLVDQVEMCVITGGDDDGKVC
jgi:hypothetical protein